MSEESQYSEHPGGWIDWFCAHEDHTFLCEVDEDFIKDRSNHIGLKSFSNYQEALTMILSTEVPEDQDLENERFLEIYQTALDIYGLLHARFIFTIKGSAIMRERFLQGKFGYCPRIYCEKQHVIPIGLAEDLKTARVKVFCPRCQEVYLPKKKSADLDGAYFGRSFPQYLLMVFKQQIKTYPDIQPKNLLLPDTVIKTEFEPTLFGFRIVGKQGSLYQKNLTNNQFNQSNLQLKIQIQQEHEMLQQQQQQPPQQQQKQKKNKKKQK